jgi:hypothetical protein
MNVCKTAKPIFLAMCFRICAWHQATKHLPRQWKLGGEGLIHNRRDGGKALAERQTTADTPTSSQGGVISGKSIGRQHKYKVEVGDGAREHVAVHSVQEPSMPRYEVT